jgi:hypothetical protein
VIWEFVQRHLQLILQALLPFGFFAVDGLLKWTSGKHDFRDTGADVCLAGFSQYVGTLLGLLYQGRITRPHDVVTAWVILFAGAVVWWTCILLSYNRIPIRKTSAAPDSQPAADEKAARLQPAAAILLGAAATFYLAGSWWNLSTLVQ